MFVFFIYIFSLENSPFHYFPSLFVEPIPAWILSKNRQSLSGLKLFCPFSHLSILPPFLFCLFFFFLLLIMSFTCRGGCCWHPSQIWKEDWQWYRNIKCHPAGPGIILLCDVVRNPYILSSSHLIQKYSGGHDHRAAAWKPLHIGFQVTNIVILIMTGPRG